MPRNLDMSLLRTFVAVADRASMTAAGNALHLTQGAVSQQVKRLESLLGNALFERDRRGLRLTTAGERMLGKARQLLGLNDEIWTDMAAADTDADEPIRLGLPYDLMERCLAPTLERYVEAHPQAEVSICCAASPDLLVKLGRGEIDLAVVEEPIGSSNGECLTVQRLVWVGAKGGSAYRKQPLPVSMVMESCALRPAVLTALRDCGRMWRTVFENGNLEATMAVVRTDLAVTAQLAFTVPSGLEILPLESGLPALPPYVVNLHLPAGGRRAATELARHIRHALAGQAPPA